MSWILHDITRRAVIPGFGSRAEAEAWRDRNGLGSEFSASPSDAPPRPRPCPAAGRDHRTGRPAHARR